MNSNLYWTIAGGLILVWLLLLWRHCYRIRAQRRFREKSHIDPSPDHPYVVTRNDDLREKLRQAIAAASRSGK